MGRKESVKAVGIAILLVIGLTFVRNPSATAADKTGSTGWKPRKAITIMVPTGPGGPYDSEARVIAGELSKVLGQPVVIENVPGAGHALASTQAYKAQPDGCTLLYAASTTIILNQFAYGARYDFRKFEYLAQAWDNNLHPTTVVVTGAKSGLKEWADVMKLNRPVRWGTAGKGNPTHTIGIAVSRAFNLKNPVFALAYTGAPDNLAAVARGEVDLACYPMSAAEPFVKSHDCQILMLISNKEKLPGYPQVPTTGELGHPEIFAQAGANHEFMAPPNTPKEITHVLSDAIYKVVSSQMMKDYFEKKKDYGWAPLTGEETRKVMEDTYKAMEPILPFLVDKKS